ncbi:MAG: helix-hairpin-helix domain-containing protein [Verrucomicrobia bacterium]|nr:helix-hairpin-helix domain-containing protein [Deltaproteobacteria bacterium]
MHPKQNQPQKLEDLPNIGKSIAADLRAIGIFFPHQLTERDPLAIYHELSNVMGHRHDPCVLYTLISAQHFLESGGALPWWKFTEQGRKLLNQKSGRQKCQTRKVSW